MHIKIFTKLIVTLLFVALHANAQINWPEGQLLPTFPAPAETQDLIYLNDRLPSTDRDELLYLFISMKGLINATQPRIFSYEGDAFAEGPYTWLSSLNLKYREYSDPWEVLTKYKDEISGLIVYDPNQLHTVNLATRLAKEYNALIAAPSLLNKLQASPYNFNILLDLRGQFTSALQVYQHVYDNYWNNTDKRVLISLSPIYHKAAMREYAIALGAAVIWIEPHENINNSAPENLLLNRFLADMPKGANVLGWWQDEGLGITRVSYFGMTTIPSDYCTNLPMHSGMPRLIEPRPIPPKPDLRNKIYVSFILSDGDNMQYVEHLMRKLWNDSGRGTVPIGWTVSPSMVDAMPGALNYYHSSATENDNLISGPSGYGYTYPNRWDTNDLADFVKKTEEYNLAAGLRVTTVWNTITGGIGLTEGNIYADNSSTLLGLTAQNTGGQMTIYRNKLPGKPLSCNYCTNPQAMRDHIASASAGWDGNSPRFLIIQAQPWNDVKPSDFRAVANSLNSDYIVVRPDHIFQLIREACGLPINPGAIEGDGNGLIGAYYNGENFDEIKELQIDNMLDFDWGVGAPLEEMQASEFSIRWKGKIQPPFSGHYTFYLTCNAVRLWIKDELIIDKGDGRTITAYSGKSYSLEAGEMYDITIEYIKRNNSVPEARIKFEWESAFLPRETVPKSQMYSVFIPVTDITDVPQTATERLPLVLTCNVIPEDATNQTIIWKLKDAGATDATIDDNILYAEETGTVTVEVFIEDGIGAGMDYKKDFTVNIVKFVAVTGITDVPQTYSANQPLALTATVEPSDASDKNIIWKVKNAGNTGATIEGNILNATDEGTVIVTATIENGVAPKSPFELDFSINISKPTTTGEDIIASDIKVYPNPTNSELKIESNGSQINIIEIFDATGRKLYTKRISQKNADSATIIINISRLPAGIYYLKIDEKMFKVSKI